MVLEKSPSQRHLISSLYQCGTEIPQTLVFILVHHVEWRGQELLTEVLGRWKVPADFRDWLVNHTKVVWSRLTVWVLLLDKLLLHLELGKHLVNTSHLLHHLLILHLLLRLCILHIISMRLSQNGCLYLQLLSFLLQPFLMIVRDEHTGLPPLLIKIPPDGSLDFNSSQVLSSHWSWPWLLNDTLKEMRVMNMLTLYPSLCFFS